MSARTGSKTVALYTVTASQNLYILLITPDKIELASSPVKEVELWTLIRGLLDDQSPLLDHDKNPTPLLKLLYNSILKPISSKLDEANAETLMWSLDGMLRYLPIAALYDDERKQYLVERYRSVVFTNANLKQIVEGVKPKLMWTGVGFGSAKEQTIKGKIFPGLRTALDELHSIIRDRGNKSGGLIEGKVFLDELFSQKNLLGALQNHPQVVHIASHFEFQPGNADDSFLVMGKGESMTLEEMKSLPTDLFHGVELLTLSACETGPQMPNANGREIAAFAELAQRKGAKAVLSTLWQSPSAANQQLMKNFYYFLRTRKGINKAEALRLAQVSLLKGGAITTNNQSINRKPPTSLPSPEFAHPRFWASFVLSGNWQ